MMPIHSPMMCMAIYIKKYLKCDDELAFISPCIAKKTEITDPNCYGYVKYNVTFKSFLKRLEINIRAVRNMRTNWNMAWVLFIRCRVV